MRDAAVTAYEAAVAVELKARFGIAYRPAYNALVVGAYRAGVPVADFAERFGQRYGLKYLESWTLKQWKGAGE